MTSFNSFEEINKAYPLLDGSNERYYVFLNSCYVLSAQDAELERHIHPYGWYDKYDSKWYYFDTNKSIWYDCYIFDGEIWTLGIYSWDEKKENAPEDKNDHMINSVQYAFIPYVSKIGKNYI